MMGPSDLSLDMGYPGQKDNPKVKDAIQRVVDACKKAGIASGTHLGSLDDLQYWMGQGMQMITYTYDTHLIINSGRAALSFLKNSE